MRHALGGVLVLLLAFLPAVADDKPDKDKADKEKTPRQQYQALLKEYSDAIRAFGQAFEKADTDEARQKLLAEKYPRPGKVAAGMMDLAEKSPKDPVALDAAAWVLTNQARGRGAGDAEVLKRAARVVREGFLESDKLGPICQQLATAPDPDVRALLTTIRDKSPHKSVQAQAALAQATSLGQQISMAQALKDQPQLAKQVEAVYGKEFVDSLLKTTPIDLEKQAAAALQDVAEKYAADMKPAELTRTMQMMAMRGGAGAEPFLQTLMDKDARNEVKGIACLTLAQVLKEKADNIPDKADELHKKAEALFEQAAAKYADVKTPFGETVGAKAKSELFDLRHLAVGKAAPDVEGVDQDGQKFKLSDYKGKVVLLDFWSQY